MVFVNINDASPRYERSETAYHPTSEGSIPLYTFIASARLVSNDAKWFYWKERSEVLSYARANESYVFDTMALSWVY